MSAVETEEFDWGLSLSYYRVDGGRTKVETLQYGNLLKDAHGNEVVRFYGGGGSYGSGTGPMGGDRRKARLPKTLQLTYYDYQEDRFYQLTAELPQRKLYELFRQRTIDRSLAVGKVMPRYNELTIGIAPGGFVMLWVNAADGREQVELAGPLHATTMPGMTVQRYNVETQPAFPLNPDRWGELSDHALKPETVAKLKAGWVPDNLYYQKQRVKYPWRYRMSGNARLLEFSEIQGNQEHFYYGPWQMGQYNHIGNMRGVPSSATFWFNDAKGRRYSIFIAFSNKNRVKGELDLSAIWDAFETVFPKQEIWQNEYAPGEADMATIDVHLSENLVTCTATLIKGTLRIDLPIERKVLIELQPYAHWNGQDTPAPDAIKLLQNGPDLAP